MIRRNRAVRVRGRGCPFAKLTDEMVIELRERYRNGEQMSDLVARFGVCDNTIHAAALGKCWTHLPGICKRRGRAHATLRGENALNAKLTEEKVREARRRAASGELLKDISHDMGVSRHAISLAIRRINWAHVD